MPNFNYRALTQDGREVVDTVEAPSQSNAMDTLRQRGLSPFSITKTNSADEKWWNKDILARSTTSEKERVLIARELATYINANVPLTDALSAIKDTLGGKPIATLFAQVIEDVQRGETLSSAFSRHEIFEQKHIGTIEAAEASGKLGIVFDQLANFLEVNKTRKSDLFSALFYPILLLIMAFGAIMFISTSLLPSLVPIFEDSGKPLPFMAGALLSMGTFLQQNWIAVLIGMCAALAITVYIWKLPTLRPARDRMLLKLPIIGLLLRDIETAQLNRSLGLMLTNGVSVVDALKVAETSLNNYHFKTAANAVIAHIQDGDDFANAYANPNLFSPISVRMIALGDKSGRLADMVQKSGDILDAQIKRQIDRAIAILTPVLTLITGVIIGGVVISVLSAILSVNDLVF